MLFILGTKSYNLKNGQIENFTCPKCSQQSKLNYSIYKRYTHVTLVPIFPIDKQIYSTCNSCEKYIELDELPKDIQTKLQGLKKNSSSIGPIWMYSGVILLLGFIIFGINRYIKADENSKVYLKNPKQEDLIISKLSNGLYSTIRIDSVTNDSVYGISNDYSMYLPYDYDEIDKPENYTKSKVKFSKQDLLKLYNVGEISSVKRK